MSLLIDQSPGGVLHISDFKEPSKARRWRGWRSSAFVWLTLSPHKRIWAICAHSVMLVPHGSRLCE